MNRLHTSPHTKDRLPAPTYANMLGLPLREGELHVILGASGSGKTTLLKKIALRSEEKIGYLTQESGLFPWYTLHENIALTQSPSYDVMPLLKDLGILPLLNKYPGRISGGEARRAEIARTVASGCSILLFDEPTTSLDDVNRLRFRQLLTSLHKKHRLTILVVTHDMEEALLLGQTISLMKDGKIVQSLSNEYYDRFSLRDSTDFFLKKIELRNALSYAAETI